MDQVVSDDSWRGDGVVSITKEAEKVKRDEQSLNASEEGWGGAQKQSTIPQHALLYPNGSTTIQGLIQLLQQSGGSAKQGHQGP